MTVIMLSQRFDQGACWAIIARRTKVTSEPTRARPIAAMPSPLKAGFLMPSSSTNATMAASAAQKVTLTARFSIAMISIGSLLSGPDARDFFHFLAEHDAPLVRAAGQQPAFLARAHPE